MSRELVKKSLYKFINDGLENVFVTYNSNYADMVIYKDNFSTNFTTFKHCRHSNNWNDCEY